MSKEAIRKIRKGATSRAAISILLVAVGVITLAIGLGITFGVGVGLAVAGGLAVAIGLILGWNEGT